MGWAQAKRFGWTSAIVPVLGAIATQSAAAEPMDLSRFEPRWVEVRFESSPPDRPGQTDTIYSQPVAAWLEPDEAAREVRVTIASEGVELHIFGGQDPVPGSFSDFTWTFDIDTGEVLSARVDGRLWHHLGPGISIQAPIRVRMDTRREAGFAPPRSLLGHVYRGLCRDPGDDCTLVEPRVYDPQTGYVNAVGDIQARSGPFRVRSFSPLGEARFSERPGGPSAPASVSAPPPDTPGEESVFYR